MQFMFRNLMSIAVNGTFVLRIFLSKHDDWTKMMKHAYLQLATAKSAVKRHQQTV